MCNSRVECLQGLFAIAVSVLLGSFLVWITSLCRLSLFNILTTTALGTSVTLLGMVLLKWGLPEGTKSDDK